MKNWGISCLTSDSVELMYVLVLRSLKLTTVEMNVCTAICIRPCRSLEKVRQCVSQDWKIGGPICTSAELRQQILQCTQYHQAMLVITKVLCAYICCRLILISPQNHVILFLKDSVFCSYSTKRVVFLLVFCLKERIQIGLFLLLGGLKDSKTHAWLTH